MALRITIGAIGVIKAPEKELYRSYIDRLSWPTTTIEIDDRKAGLKRQAFASAKLLALVPDGARMVVLDETGRSFDSRTFANDLRETEQDGIRDIVFLIGGADGHSNDLVSAAHLVLSFGKQTWPHMLARVMLAEQLYRAGTILSGHPYHRD